MNERLKTAVENALKEIESMSPEELYQSLASSDNGVFTQLYLEEGLLPAIIGDITHDAEELEQFPVGQELLTKFPFDELDISVIKYDAEELEQFPVGQELLTEFPFDELDISVIKYV